jgi:hypothetical protein
VDCERNADRWTAAECPRLSVAGGPGAGSKRRTPGSVLFGIQPLDIWSFAIAPLILLAVAALASVVPARRAAATDPVVALKCE